MKNALIFMVAAIVMLPFTSCEKNEIDSTEQTEQPEAIQTLDPAGSHLSDEFIWQTGYPNIEADEDGTPIYMYLQFAWTATMLPPDGHISEFIVEIYEVDCGDRNMIISGPVFTTAIPAFPGEVTFYNFESEITGTEPGKCYAMKITTPEGTVIWEWTSFIL